jgi:hypothetical protein
MSHAYDVVSHDAAEETIYPAEILHEDPPNDENDFETNNPHERLINYSSDRAARFRSKDGHLEGRRKSVDEIDPEESKKWLNPYSTENIGIFASYLSVGFGMYFIQTPLQYYMVKM